MRILLTNDDGPDSPLLRTAIRCVRKYGEVTVVVPSQEQSWMGKRVTRFGNIETTTIEIGGQQVHCFGGSPADCANYGIYHLFEGKPDLVVSGINIGENHGLGLLLSSGTVGACLEANIAEIPGVALSQELFIKPQRKGWNVDREPQLERLVGSAFDLLKDRPDFLREPVTWSFNFPFEPAEHCELKRAAIGHTRYGSFFEGSNGVFSFTSKLEWPAFDERDVADGKLLKQGHVSVTRIDIRKLGQDTDW